MKIPLFIPYINRPDMLERVCRMAVCPNVEINILDNSDGPSIMFSGIPLIYRRPTVPLSFTQTQNWMLKITQADADYGPFYMWVHCDALLEPDSVERLYVRAMEECDKGTKWGVIYTHYDILSACNVEAMETVGGYDTLFFDYASDCDYYRRLDLAGYARLESGIKVGHDQGSQTIRSDPAQNRRVGIQVDYRGRLYRAMWGGDPGREMFATKWGGRIG